MWTGFCGNLIRSRNRNLLRTLLFFAAGPCLFLGYFHRYYTGLFQQPPSVSIAQTRSWTLAEAEDRFVRVKVNRWTRTGIDETGTHDKWDPTVYFDGTYLLADAGGSNILILVGPGEVPATFTALGLLTPTTDRLSLRSQFGSNDGVDPQQFGPVFINALTPRRFALWLIVIVGLLLPAFVMLVNYVWRVANPAHHPFARRLATYGPLASLVPQLDLGMSTAHVTMGSGNNRAEITKHWLIAVQRSTAIPMLLESIVWYYNVRNNSKPSLHHADAHDGHGRKWSLKNLQPDAAAAITRTIKDSGLAHNAIRGYDARTASLWRVTSDKHQFLAAWRALPPAPPITGARRTWNGMLSIPIVLAAMAASAIGIRYLIRFLDSF